MNPSAEGRAVSEQVAYWLTLIVNPLVLPPFTVFLTLNAMQEPLQSTLIAVAIATACFAAVPFVVMLIVAAQSKNVTIELRNRKDRTVPFLASIVLNAVALVLFTRWDSDLQGLMVALMVVYLINNVLLLTINFRFKISLHMASISGTAAILYFMRFGTESIPPGGGRLLLAAAIVCSLMIPVLWWSRQRLDAHTRPELAWGMTFGLLMPSLELVLLAPVFA